MIKISFLIYPGFSTLDLAGPIAVFEAAENLTNTPHYEIEVLSEHGGVVPSYSNLGVASKAWSNQKFDTLIVVGGPPATKIHTMPGLLEITKLAGRRAKRLASVCTGAFILAEAGFLDGRRATTHWRSSARLKQNYNKIKVDADCIYINDGNIWTSAGVSAGIDLGLAIVEKDFGVQLAKDVARLLVVYHRRAGGQTQFSSLLDLEPATDRIKHILSFARENLDKKLTVERLALEAHLSERQFSRLFLSETGETPAKAVERLRIEAARQHLEHSDRPIEEIASSVGFNDPERMRRAFVRMFGYSPQAIRRQAKNL